MMEFIKVMFGVFAGVMAASFALFGLATNKKFLKWYSNKYMDVINEVTGDLVDKF